MGYLRHLKEQICVSLFLHPASLHELMARDFLKHHSVEGIDRLLHSLERDKWVYCRNETYYTYQRIAQKYLKEYEL